jgi:hypothetical protein
MDEDIVMIEKIELSLAGQFTRKIVATTAAFAAGVLAEKVFDKVIEARRKGHLPL